MTILDEYAEFLHNSLLLIQRRSTNFQSLPIIQTHLEVIKRGIQSRLSLIKTNMQRSALQDEAQTFDQLMKINDDYAYTIENTSMKRKPKLLFSADGIEIPFLTLMLLIQQEIPINLKAKRLYASFIQDRRISLIFNPLKGLMVNIPSADKTTSKQEFITNDPLFLILISGYKLNPEESHIVNLKHNRDFDYISIENAITLDLIRLYEKAIYITDRGRQFIHDFQDLLKKISQPLNTDSLNTYYDVLQTLIIEFTNIRGDFSQENWIQQRELIKGLQATEGLFNPTTKRFSLQEFFEKSTYQPGIWGISGPLGTGKSTSMFQLIKLAMKEEKFPVLILMNHMTRGVTDYYLNWIDFNELSSPEDYLILLLRIAFDNLSEDSEYHQITSGLLRDISDDPHLLDRVIIFIDGFDEYPGSVEFEKFLIYALNKISSKYSVIISGRTSVFQRLQRYRGYRGAVIYCQVYSLTYLKGEQVKHLISTQEFSTQHQEMINGFFQASDIQQLRNPFILKTFLERELFSQTDAKFDNYSINEFLINSITNRFLNRNKFEIDDSESINITISRDGKSLELEIEYLQEIIKICYLLIVLDQFTETSNIDRQMRKLNKENPFHIPDQAEVRPPIEPIFDRYSEFDVTRLSSSLLRVLSPIKQYFYQNDDSYKLLCEVVIEGLKEGNGLGKYNIETNKFELTSNRLAEHLILWSLNLNFQSKSYLHYVHLILDTFWFTDNRRNISNEMYELFIKPHSQLQKSCEKIFTYLSLHRQTALSENSLIDFNLQIYIEKRLYVNGILSNLIPLYDKYKYLELVLQLFQCESDIDFQNLNSEANKIVTMHYRHQIITGMRAKIGVLNSKNPTFRIDFLPMIEQILSTYQSIVKYQDKEYILQDLRFLKATPPIITQKLNLDVKVQPVRLHELIINYKKICDLDEVQNEKIKLWVRDLKCFEEILKIKDLLMFQLQDPELIEDINDYTRIFDQIEDQIEEDLILDFIIKLLRNQVLVNIHTNIIGITLEQMGKQSITHLTGTLKRTGTNDLFKLSSFSKIVSYLLEFSVQTENKLELFEQYKKSILEFYNEPSPIDFKIILIVKEIFSYFSDILFFREIVLINSNLFSPNVDISNIFPRFTNEEINLIQLKQQQFLLFLKENTAEWPEHKILLVKVKLFKLLELSHTTNNTEKLNDVLFEFCKLIESGEGIVDNLSIADLKFYLQSCKYNLDAVDSTSFNKNGYGIINQLVFDKLLNRYSHGFSSKVITQSTVINHIKQLYNDINERS